MTQSETIDPKFIYTASGIGAVYAVVVAIVGTWLGKEAAGIAGVALTGLATALFKQFETLRFRQIAEHEVRVVTVPRMDGWYLGLLICAFVGLQFLAGMVMGAALISLGLWRDPSLDGSFWELITDVKMLVSLVGLVAACHFATGYVCGRTAPGMTLSCAVIGSFFSTVLQTILPILAAVSRDWNMLRLLAQPGTYTFGIFWLAYASCALAGARWGMRRGGRSNPGLSEHDREETFVDRSLNDAHQRRSLPPQESAAPANSQAHISRPVSTPAPALYVERPAPSTFIQPRRKRS